MDWALLQKTHDCIAQTAFNIYLQHQSLDPQVMIMQAGQPDRMVMVSPKAVAAMYESKQGKDHLSRLIRSLVDPTSASAKGVQSQYGFLPEVVVQIHEATMFNIDTDTGRKDEASTQDCVMVVLHTAFGSIPVAHPIAQNPYPHVTPAPFPGPDVLENIRGRFTIQGDPEEHSVDAGAMDMDDPSQAHPSPSH